MVKSINIIGSYVGCAYIARFSEVQSRTLILPNLTATAKTRVKPWILLQWAKSSAIMLSSRCRHYLRASRSKTLQMYRNADSFVRVYEGMEQGTIAGRVVLNMD